MQRLKCIKQELSRIHICIISKPEIFEFSGNCDIFTSEGSVNSYIFKSGMVINNYFVNSIENIDVYKRQILNNPENNLKQKDIAIELYINSSYLSTVFPAQTGIRFVDYLTTVKLKRAVRCV